MRVLRSHKNAIDSDSTNGQISDQNITSNEPKQKKHKKNKKNKNYLITESNSEQSVISIKPEIVENLNCTPFKMKRKKSNKNDKKCQRKTYDSPVFKNVVTSTAIKPSRPALHSWPKSSKHLSENYKIEKSPKIQDDTLFMRSESFGSIIEKSEFIKTPNVSSKTRKSIHDKKDDDNKSNKFTDNCGKKKRINKEQNSLIIIDDESTKNVELTNESHIERSLNITKENQSDDIFQNDVIINVSDSIVDNSRQTNNMKIETSPSVIMNSTFCIESNKEDEIEKHNSTFELSPHAGATSNSGEWKVSNLFTNSISYIGSKKEENKVLTSADTEVSPTKSLRKKWECFARNSLNAQQILERIATPKKNSTLSTKKSSNVSLQMHKTLNSNIKKHSVKKVDGIKRTLMPNFSLIHQKANEQMESIVEYSDRKKERAKMLLSATKLTSIKKFNKNEENQLSATKQSPSIKKVNKNEQNQLKMKEKYSGIKSNFNRFGFKLKNSTVEKLEPVKLNFSATKIPNIAVVKPSIFARDEIMTIANKKAPNILESRENKRGILKGVRTNRRFELLMKMRQK